MSEASIDLEHLKTWIGSEVVVSDEIDQSLVERFAATFDLDPDHYLHGKDAPAGIHWCLSPLLAPTSQLGPDGHPARGGFLPPVALPRRMWAGGKLNFLGRFQVGQVITKTSRVADIRLKQGRTGSLVFVTVHHDYSSSGAILLREQQDIVYRDIAPSQTKDSDGEGMSGEPVPCLFKARADAPLLFRYSALNFNTHRIHYDRAYCVDEEFYPGLVVHGPLQATYLLRLSVEHNGWPTSFVFRGQAPLFDGDLTVNGPTSAQPGEFSVRDPKGRVTMTASVTW